MGKKWRRLGGVELVKLSVLRCVYIYAYTYIYTRGLSTPSVPGRSPERRTINHFIIVINDLSVAGCFRAIKPEQRLNSCILGCLRPFYSLAGSFTLFLRLRFIYYHYFFFSYSHCFLSANVILFYFIIVYLLLFFFHPDAAAR